VSSINGNTLRRWTSAEVVDELERVARVQERRPTQQDVTECGRLSVGTVYKHFDSWGEAVEAATAQLEIVEDS
jgi:hypothetical protein